MLISKRILQSINDPWNNSNTKKTKIPSNMFTDEVRIKSKRKKTKKQKTSTTSYWKVCPFCYEELPLINKDSHWLLGKRQTWCNKCGASWVPSCPACGKETWLSLEGKYKHPNVGCGFVGKKKENK